MMDANLKSKVVKGVFWTLLEKFSVQIVGFVVGMVLARLLTPTDYGTVALTGIFFAIANVLVDSGFGIALIHKKNADRSELTAPQRSLLLPIGPGRQCAKPDPV